MKKYSKIFAALVLVLCVIYFFKYDVASYLSLDFIKSKMSDFQTYYQENAITTILAYMLIYISVTALSLPGAAILTLLGGALFGLGIGVVVVSFSSTIGATLAFLVSRFFLQDWVQTQFKTNLKTLNEGIAKEGALYLFTLRLIPAVPFFVINLVMGVLPVNVFTFYWVSQVGMFAGTFVYVNAGKQLANITSLSGILSPPLLASFVLLGVFPIFAKKVLNYFKSQKILNRFKKPSAFEYNLVVIGGGSAGLVTAYIAAAAQSKVVLIDKHKMGGDCLNTGCVPSKSLIRTAKFLADVKKSETLGIKKATVEMNFSDVMERVQRIIRKIEPHDSMERYRSLGVECIQGSAKIISPYEVEVNGKRLTTKSIVIASGAGPLLPPIPGLKNMDPLTSDNLWDLRDQPKKLLVLGGGPIGCELSQAFQRLGCQVTQLEKAPRILLREDQEISKLIADKMQEIGRAHV